MVQSCHLQFESFPVPLQESVIKFHSFSFFLFKFLQYFNKLFTFPFSNSHTLIELTTVPIPSIHCNQCTVRQPVRSSSLSSRLLKMYIRTTTCAFLCLVGLILQTSVSLVDKLPLCLCFRVRHLHNHATVFFFKFAIWELQEHFLTESIFH